MQESQRIALFLKMVRCSNCLRIAGIGGLFTVIAFFSSISTISAQSVTKPTSKPSADDIARANITYEVIRGEGGGYGYDVYADGRKLIHQPNIPGQPGMAGFKKKEDSKRVAELVIKKIKNKELPPSVTTEELRQLKVID